MNNKNVEICKPCYEEYCKFPLCKKLDEEQNCKVKCIHRYKTK